MELHVVLFSPFEQLSPKRCACMQSKISRQYGQTKSVPYSVPKFIELWFTNARNTTEILFNQPYNLLHCQSSAHAPNGINVPPYSESK